MIYNPITKCIALMRPAYDIMTSLKGLEEVFIVMATKKRLASTYESYDKFPDRDSPPEHFYLDFAKHLDVENDTAIIYRAKTRITGSNSASFRLK